MFLFPIKISFKSFPFKERKKIVACKVRGLDFISLFIKACMYTKHNLPFPAASSCTRTAEGRGRK